MWRIAVVLLVLAGCGMNGNYRDTSVPMESVSRFDAERYAGLWYEIARFPNRFERDCTAVTAEYTLRDDGRIGVRNSCRKNSPDGPLEVAEGVARVVAPGELKVKFVQWLPFESDYWVIALDEAYQWSVVGTPSGDFGWILARSPQMAPEDLAAAKAALEADGYDLSRLHWTRHAE